MQGLRDLAGSLLTTAPPLIPAATHAERSYTFEEQRKRLPIRSDMTLRALVWWREGGWGAGGSTDLVCYHCLFIAVHS